MIDIKLNYALVALALLTLGQSALALEGTMLSPLRAELSANKKVETFTLTNYDAPTKLIQVEAYLWEQKNNQDVLTPTKNLVVSPPIFKLKKDQNQIVRTLFKPQAAQSVEQSYRLVFKEVAHVDGLTRSDNSVAVFVHMSVPVFVMSNSPVEPKNKSIKDADLPTTGLLASSKRFNDESIEIRLVNNQLNHLQIISAQLRNKQGALTIAENMSGYILPKNSRSWTIKKQPNPTDLQIKTTRGEIIIPLAQE